MIADDVAAAGPALRVALLLHTLGAREFEDTERAVRAIADGLRVRGHRPTIISSHLGPRERRADAIVVRRLPERLLRARGFTGPLTHGGGAVGELLRGRFDVVQVFTPEDMAPAVAWRRMTQGRLVFTSIEPMGREVLADRRLRMRLVSMAVEGGHPVTAGSTAAQTALERWLAVTAPVVAPGELEPYEEPVSSDLPSVSR